MRKLLGAAVLAMTLGLPRAWAEPQSLLGYSVGANLNFISTSAEVHNGTFSGSIGDTDAMLSLQGGYIWRLGWRF